MQPMKSFLRMLRPGMRIFVHAGPAESLALRETLSFDPGLAEGVVFNGAFIAGVNEFDYAGLTETTRSVSVFVPRAARGSFEAQRYAFVPLAYSQLPAFFSRGIDLAIVHASPDRGGIFSCGINADVVAHAASHANEVAVIVNPQMPWTNGAVSTTHDRVGYLVDGDGPLMRTAREEPDARALSIGRRIAGEIRDGDTLQIGNGTVPLALPVALSAHRRLKMHTGAIFDNIAVLLDSGTIESPADIVTGMAIGSEPVWHASRREGIRFCGVDVTHSVRRISEIVRFIAVNAAIEVDLSGQVNSEVVRGRQVSGIGGASDFARAAMISAEGRSIIALPSTVGARSRIVARISDGVVSQPRSDADLVVTEHGVARLRHLSIDERADALIAIAAPEHRNSLAEEWCRLRASL